MTSGDNLFTAVTDHISSGSAATLQKVQDIQTLLGRLNGLVDESNEYWRGPASDQFKALMAQYHADSTQLNQALSAIGHALQTSGTNISSAEHTNVGNLNKIQLPRARL